MGGISKQIFLTINLFIFVMQLAHASNPQGTVNILTWVGYLESPLIAQKIKNRCGVDIYYDEYYSTKECSRRISYYKDFYDILIFPGVLYNDFKGKIENNSSTLAKEVVKKYDDSIKSRYLSYNYPNNVVFFTFSVAGFIWNKSKIKLSADDSLGSAFQKAGKNIVVLMNDLICVWSLIRNQICSDESSSVKNAILYFSKLTSNCNVYISNGYNRLYDHEQFTFAFQRSGDIVDSLKKSQQPYEFLIHPQLSFVSHDLMAVLNNRKETTCVARVLASRDVLEIVQQKSYFLSPYNTYKQVNDLLFKKVYKSLSGLCDLPWLEGLFSYKYGELSKFWHGIHMLPNFLKNNPDN